MFYCNKECQRKDWKIHKFECKTYKKYYEATESEDYYHDYASFNDYYRLLLRLHLTLEHFPDLRNQSFKVPETDPPQYRSYDDLLARQEDIKIDEERFPMFEKILKFFRKAQIDFHREKLFETFCKIMINRFYIENAKLKKIGLSIFILESGFEHSCIPNASLVFNGANLQVRALKSISPGEKITINYRDEVITQKERQERLKELFYFTCSCSKCLEYKDEGKFF